MGVWEWVGVLLLAYLGLGAVLLAVALGVLLAVWLRCKPPREQHEGATAETPNRKPPQGGSGTAPPRSLTCSKD